MSAAILSVRNVAYRFPKVDCDAVRGISAEVATPQVVAIAGPNGAGKSTLLDLISGQRTPSEGSVLYAGADLRGMSRQAICQYASHVPQQTPAAIPFSVEQVVLTGRTPHGRGLYENDADRAAAAEAMEFAGIPQALRQRPFQELSGGERQRVLLAAAICQQAKLLLLDEPAAHLDPANEAFLWQLLHRLRDRGTTVVAVTHHLALAARHADRVWLLHRGSLAADGTPGEVLQPGTLGGIFAVPFYRQSDGEGRVFLTYGS
ncbi:hemin import ATP-binding protein HmuV [Bryobacterales bacterium F-183]|nr:hemin import ATP-binding protein HmuV [Bryobacterales bacterium F-183]